jgi:heme/copper-type cytochrome/quinol oxidase subunit 2
MVVVVVVVIIVVIVIVVFVIPLYKSLQNDDRHIKKEITIEVIVHKIKK